MNQSLDAFLVGIPIGLQQQDISRRSSSDKYLPSAPPFIQGTREREEGEEGQEGEEGEEEHTLSLSVPVILS